MRLLDGEGRFSGTGVLRNERVPVKRTSPTYPFTTLIGLPARKRATLSAVVCMMR
jgi:hypothetical protein